MKKTIMFIIAVAMTLSVLVGCGKKDTSTTDTEKTLTISCGYDDPDTETAEGYADMYVVEHHDYTLIGTGEVYHGDDEVRVVFVNGDIRTMTRSEWNDLKEMARG